ncbi:MAG: hypothetical protein VX951_13465 [Planctomycetota bacterium]|nr:hypothetical protein [Planctomycetota bacterium]
MRYARQILGLAVLVPVLSLPLASCTFTDVEGLQSLREKPALPYSVLITGGGFVQVPVSPDAAGLMSRTFKTSDSRLEAFDLEQLRRTLDSGNVFVANKADSGPVADRLKVSGGPFLNDEALQSVLARARAGGHDFLLVVERIQDGPVELREINDRWPFTLAAWLFGMGALIPDHTYESEARLQVSLRDAYSGRRVSAQQIIIEPGPIDLNMFERCGLLGFVQSVLWPPFFTSTDPDSIVESMELESASRMLISLVRRLKSAEVREQLYRSGTIMISARAVGGGWQISVDTQEPISAVALRFDGRELQSDATRGFEQALLSSGKEDGDQWEYRAVYSGKHGKGVLQFAVQTEAAKVRSMTIKVGED